MRTWEKITVGVALAAATGVLASVGFAALNIPTAQPTPAAPVSIVKIATTHPTAIPTPEPVAAPPAPAPADPPPAEDTSSDNSGGWADGEAPAGTPIPWYLDTDPNSGSYNQMALENPDQFCASNGGTTAPDGTQVCS